MRRALLAVAGLAVAACGTAGATAPSVGTPEPVEAIVEDWRVRTPAPGVVVGLSAPGDPDRVIAAGARTRGGPPIEATDRFRAGSVTKVLVASVVLQLVDEGRLVLDAPPPLAADGTVATMLSGVTVRQLLRHTSGIPDVGRSPRLLESLTSEPERVWSSRELLGVAAGASREFEPGTAFGYSNTNYLVLGEVIEAVTGNGWAAEVRARILDEIGMDQSHIAGAEDPGAAPVAGYFDFDGDGFTEPVPDPWPGLDSSEGAAGALVSTAGDLIRFAESLFGGALVSDASLAEMTEPGPHSSRFTGYGLGLEVHRPDLDTLVWGHSGFVPGHRSVLWHSPATSTTVVVLTNESRSRPDGLAELVMTAVTG